MTPPPVIPALPVAGMVRTKPRVLADGERLLPTLLAAGVIVALGDLLFWGHTPGLSLAIFGAVVASMMLLKGGRVSLRPRVLIPFALLLASAAQTAIEMSFTNMAVIAALFAVLMAELHFTKLPAGWARWSESLVAWFGAPGRWVWLARAVGELPVSQDGTTAR